MLSRWSVSRLHVDIFCSQLHHKCEHSKANKSSKGAHMFPLSPNIQHTQIYRQIPPRCRHLNKHSRCGRSNLALPQQQSLNHVRHASNFRLIRQVSYRIRCQYALGCIQKGRPFDKPEFEPMGNHQHVLAQASLFPDSACHAA